MSKIKKSEIDAEKQEHNEEAKKLAISIAGMLSVRKCYVGVDYAKDLNVSARSVTSILQLARKNITQNVAAETSLLLTTLRTAQSALTTQQINYRQHPYGLPDWMLLLHKQGAYTTDFKEALLHKEYQKKLLQHERECLQSIDFEMSDLLESWREVSTEFEIILRYEEETKPVLNIEKMIKQASTLKALDNLTESQIMHLFGFGWAATKASWRITSKISENNYQELAETWGEAEVYAGIALACSCYLNRHRTGRFKNLRMLQIANINMATIIIQKNRYVNKGKYDKGVLDVAMSICIFNAAQGEQSTDRLDSNFSDYDSAIELVALYKQINTTPSYSLTEIINMIRKDQDIIGSNKISKQNLIDFMNFDDEKRVLLDEAEEYIGTLDW